MVPIDTLDPTFCDAGADVTLRSSNGVLFRVHSCILTLSSSYFREKLDCLRKKNPIVQLREEADVIRAILKTIYPDHDLCFISDFAFLRKVAFAAQNYGMDDVSGMIRSFFIHEKHDISLVDIYILASELGWQNEVELTAWRIKKKDINIVEMRYRSVLLTLSEEQLDPLLSVLSPKEEFDYKGLTGPNMDYKRYDNRRHDVEIRTRARFSWWELLSRRAYNLVTFPDADVVVFSRDTPPEKFYAHSVVLKLGSKLWAKQLMKSNELHSTGNAEILKALLDFVYYPMYSQDAISPIQASFKFLSELCYAANEIESTTAMRLTRRIFKQFLRDSMRKEREMMYRRSWSWKEAYELAVRLNWEEEIEDWKIYVGQTYQRQTLD